jgi:hypothetical protein
MFKFQVSKIVSETFETLEYLEHGDLTEFFNLNSYDAKN